MAASSREARSARREALRRQSHINTLNSKSSNTSPRSTSRSPSKVTKQVAKVPRKSIKRKTNVQAAMKSALKASRQRPTEIKAAGESDREPENCKEQETVLPTKSDPIESEMQPKKIEPKVEVSDQTDSVSESNVAVTSPILDTTKLNKVEPVPEQEATLSTPSTESDMKPAMDMGDLTAEPFQPMSPSSPMAPQAEPITPPIEEMSDDDLQRYLSEFEAASQGEYPDPEPVSHTSLSPELESIEKPMYDITKPMSPLSLGHGEFQMPEENMTNDHVNNLHCMSMSPEVEEELKIDEYITYNDNTTEANESSDVDLTSFPKRHIPFCIYRPRQHVSPVSTSFNPNKRTLLAASETVAADSQHVSREAYIQSVMLAAASLNQRSMITGLARQTMAPALGTSH